MEPLSLLHGVREVSRLADPQWPGEATQRAFDAARGKSPEHAGLPDARRIAEALGLPWRTITELAQEDEGKHAHLLGQKRRAAHQPDWLTEDHIGFVVGWVASRQGTRSVTAIQYEAERKQILAEVRRRQRRRGQLLLPTADQIARIVGWEQALYLAELARPGRWAKRALATRVEVIERFYEQYGVQPSRIHLMDFARGNGIPMSYELGEPWSQAVRDWKRAREENGLPVPDKPPRRRVADYSRDVGAALPGEHWRHGKRRDDPGALVGWVRRYLEDLGPGERSTERGYEAWAMRHPGAPRASVLIKRGGWGHNRRAAQGQIADAGRAKGRQPRQ